MKATVAEFKRQMVVGSVWSAVHKYIGDCPSEPKPLGERVCSVSRATVFGFETSTGRTSYCDFPKASELSRIDENTWKITKDGFVELTYIKIS